MCGVCTCVYIAMLFILCLSYGCCDDGVTEASGPDQQGCPGRRADCETSRWQCCRDGVTKASGPDYLGCSGDPQPCDISAYGCCPNGQTVAQGDNFQGCEDSVEVSMWEYCGHINSSKIYFIRVESKAHILLVIAYVPI